MEIKLINIGFGNVVSQVSPDTGTTTFTYDNAGNIASRTNALGQKTSFSYDALNRLTNISKFHDVLLS